MDRIPLRTRALFASGVIGMSLVGFRFGDFAAMLQEIPKWVPERTALPYAASIVMLAGGIGLLVERVAARAARLLFYYLAAWLVLLVAPIVVRAPLVEVNWQGMGEILVILAGAWVLHAGPGARGARVAQMVFGFALLPLGLAHFVYLNMTAPLVPAWLPWHTAWAYVTGAAQMAAGAGVLLSIVPRLAATLDAVLLTAFTFLVWIPPIIDKPGSQGLWSEIAVSWAITAGAWVVATSFPPHAQPAAAGGNVA